MEHEICTYSDPRVGLQCSFETEFVNKKYSGWQPLIYQDIYILCTYTSTYFVPIHN